MIQFSSFSIRTWIYQLINPEIEVWVLMNHGTVKRVRGKNAKVHHIWSMEKHDFHTRPWNGFFLGGVWQFWCSWTAETDSLPTTSILALDHQYKCISWSWFEVFVHFWDFQNSKKRSKCIKHAKNAANLTKMLEKTPKIEHNYYKSWRILQNYCKNVLFFHKNARKSKHGHESTLDPTDFGNFGVVGKLTVPAFQRH